MLMELPACLNRTTLVSSWSVHLHDNAAAQRYGQLVTGMLLPGMPSHGGWSMHAHVSAAAGTQAASMHLLMP